MTCGTAYFDLEADPALFERTVRALAEGNSIQGTARIVQIDKDTGCAWLTRAAQQGRWVVLSHWRELTVTEGQLDEWWSFIHTKGQNLPTARQWGETYGDAWVWVAFAPEWRLVVGLVVGQRTQAQANLLLERVVYVTDDHVPFLTSDPWPGYPTALLHAYGEWYPPERQGKRGRYPAPRCRPPPNLLYAQVVERREKGRGVEVTRQRVWGSADALAGAISRIRHPHDDQHELGGAG